MDIAKTHILEYLDEISIDCETYDHFYNLAMVSTNFDRELSKIYYFR